MTTAGEDEPSVCKAITLLLIAGLAVYANCFGGAFILDDNLWILDGAPEIQLFPEWYTLTIRWVANRTLAVNYALDGRNVRGYHIVNLAIHIGAALALFGLIRRTLALPGAACADRRAATWLAFAVALCWLVHPLASQSVDYIIQRHESLMGLFLLLTFYCFVRGVTSSWYWVWYAGSVVSCGLGVGCKEVIVGAPLLLLLYDWIFLGETWSQIVSRRWGLYLALVTVTWVHLDLMLKNLTMELHEGGAGSNLQGITRWTYLMTEAGVLVHYLRLALWPWPLCFDYHSWPIVGSLADCWPAGLLILGLLAATGYGLWKRSWLGFVGAWFFIILAPSSSFVPLLDPAFEYRMYLPLIAVVALVVFGGYAALQRLRPRFERPAWPATVLPSLLVLSVALPFGALTLRRNEDYRTQAIMWSDVVAQRPQSSRAQASLAIFLRVENRHEEALRHFREALRLEPNYDLAYVYLVESLLEAGLQKEALQETHDAIKRNAWWPMAHHNLGMIQLEQGRIEEAIESLEQAIDLRPQVGVTHVYYAAALLQQRRFEEAALQCRIVRNQNRAWMETYNQQARQLILKEAPSAREIRRAIVLAELICFAAREKEDPSVLDASAVVLLGSPLASGPLLAAATLFPGRTEAEPRFLDTLAIAYALAGRFGDATAAAEEALARATVKKQTALAEEIRRRLDGYRRQQAYRYARPAA